MLEHPPPNDKPMIEGQGISSGPYQATQDGIFWLRDGPPGVMLTNDPTRIIEEIGEDDGMGQGTISSHSHKCSINIGQN